MKKKKSTTTTYSIIYAFLIALVSFLPFFHDWEIFKGQGRIAGFKSLRVAVWITSLFVIAISGWIVAFINSRNKPYRFVMILPIAMLLFQLFVYILDARKTQVNTFNAKVIINGVLILLLIGFYFFKKRR